MSGGAGDSTGSEGMAWGELGRQGLSRGGTG